VLTSKGSSEFEEREADESNRGSNRDGGDEFEDATHESAEADDHFEDRSDDDCPLDMAHTHLESGISEGCHAADRDCWPEEGEGASLDDRKPGAEGGLEESTDSAHQKHGADEEGEFAIGRSEMGLEEKRDGYGGAKHGEVMLEAQEERSAEWRLVFDSIEHSESVSSAD